MKSRTYIMIVILVGVSVTVYLAIFMPTMVPIVLPALVSAGIVVIPLLAKMGETEAKVDSAIVAAKSAVVASKDNAVAIENVSTLVSENTSLTETTKVLVDGQAKEWKAAIETIAKLQAQVAALVGNAEGREEGRQIAIDLLATNAQAPAAQVPAIQPDGTVVVTAPVQIAVKAPGEG